MAASCHQLRAHHHLLAAAERETDEHLDVQHGTQKEARSLLHTKTVQRTKSHQQLILATLQSVSISFDLGMILFLLPVLNQLG